jgi:hypothetical protein
MGKTLNWKRAEWTADDDDDEDQDPEEAGIRLVTRTVGVDERTNLVAKEKGKTRHVRRDVMMYRWMGSHDKEKGRNQEKDSMPGVKIMLAQKTQNIFLVQGGQSRTQLPFLHVVITRRAHLRHASL